MTDTSEQTKTPRTLSDRTYMHLKTIVQLWLPASATLYFTLAAVWGWPNAEAVVATAAAVATFGGVVLRITTKAYNNSDAGFVGTINVSDPTPDSKLYSLDIDGDPADLSNQSEVTFRVHNPSE